MFDCAVALNGTDGTREDVGKSLSKTGIEQPAIFLSAAYAFLMQHSKVSSCPLFHFLLQKKVRKLYELFYMTSRYAWTFFMRFSAYGSKSSLCVVNGQSSSGAESDRSFGRTASLTNNKSCHTRDDAFEGG